MPINQASDALIATGGMGDRSVVRVFVLPCRDGNEGQPWNWSTVDGDAPAEPSDQDWMNVSRSALIVSA
jgi:hypothetical protein